MFAIGITVAILLLCLAAWFLVRRNKKRSDKLKLSGVSLQTQSSRSSLLNGNGGGQGLNDSSVTNVAVASVQTSMTQETTSSVPGIAGLKRNQTSDSTQTAQTWRATIHELSIPAFLQLDYGVDFTLVPPDGSSNGKGQNTGLVAVGGSAKLFECIPKSQNLLDRITATSSRSTSSPPDRVIMKQLCADLHLLPDAQIVGFFNELSLMWRFRDHPYFVKVYGYTERPGAFLMRMYDLGDVGQWIQGKTLSRVLQKHPDLADSAEKEKLNRTLGYSKASVVNMLKKMHEAVAYMHLFGFAHCDLKPSNFLIDVDKKYGDLVPVLTDFGISRVLNPAEMQVKAFPISPIRGASMAYASPEIFRSKTKRVAVNNGEALKRADVYSMSVLICEMLKRKVPWPKNIT